MSCARWLPGGTWVVALLVLPVGQAALRAQDRGAVPALEAVARRDSLDPQAHYELGVALVRARRYGEADASLRTAIRLDPRMAQAHLALAIARDRDRDFWTRLRRTGRDSGVSRELQARLASFRRAFTIDPLVDLMVLSLGDPRQLGLPLEDGYERTWVRADSVWNRMYTGAGTVDSMPPPLLWIHGVLSAHTNRLPMAILDITALISAMRIIEDQGHAGAVPLRTNAMRHLLAALQMRAGNRVQAIALYREVVENDISNYMALVQLAAAHEAGQEWNQALSARRAAIITNPEDPSLRVDLAETLLHARQAARAETLLVDVLPDLPHDPRALLLLGRILWAEDKRAEARETYETFLTFAPGRWTEQITEARSRIATPP